VARFDVSQRRGAGFPASSQVVNLRHRPERIVADSVIFPSYLEILSKINYLVDN
jgi:hypothetical protein